MRSISIASIAGLLAAGSSASALAQEDVGGMSPFSAVDAYVSYSDLQSEGGGAGADVDDADIGGGLRLRMGFGDLFFLDGGFQSVSIDNPDRASGGSAQGSTVRFREQHISGGLRYALFDERLTPYISVGEYRPRIRVNDPDGSSRVSDSSLLFGAGADFVLMRGLHLSGQYRLADDLDVGEFEEITAGAAYELSTSVGIFAEYRIAEIDFDGGGSFESNDIRLGLRFSFASESEGEDFY